MIDMTSGGVAGKALARNATEDQWQVSLGLGGSRLERFEVCSPWFGNKLPWFPRGVIKERGELFF